MAKSGQGLPCNWGNGLGDLNLEHWILNLALVYMNCLPVGHSPGRGRRGKPARPRQVAHPPFSRGRLSESRLGDLVEPVLLVCYVFLPTRGCPELQVILDSEQDNFLLQIG